VPTPEELRQYRRMSAMLREIGRIFSRELPTATASLHLCWRDGLTRLDAYDRTGRFVGRLLAVHMSESFRQAIERLGKERCPDPEGVVSPL
jgi:hypothetical protein